MLATLVGLLVIAGVLPLWVMLAALVRHLDKAVKRLTWGEAMGGAALLAGFAVLVLAVAAFFIAGVLWMARYIGAWLLQALGATG